VKILHLIDSGGLYGAEVMLLNLATEQVRLGLEPIIGSIGELGIEEKPLEAEARRMGLRVEVFRMRPGPNWFGAAQVLRFAWCEGVQLFHSHGYKCNILFGLLPRPVRRMPMVSTVHGWTGNEQWTRMKIYEKLDAFSLRLIDKVILVNEGMLGLPRFQNRIGKNAVVVNNGVPEPASGGTPQATDPEIVSYCKGGFTFGAIGRLSPEKGFDVLLHAFAMCKRKFPGTRLLILGEGRERRRLELVALELGLEDEVFMPGYRAQAYSYLPFLRGFVLSSHTEGLPMVLLEAMQAGIPVVATRVGGIPSVLEDGACGLIVPSGDPVELAGAMLHMFETNEDSRVRALRAQARVSERYSSRAMARGYVAIYQSLPLAWGKWRKRQI
jgi:glycosyltransferase involved in cell wall biosynthesis